MSKFDSGKKQHNGAPKKAGNIKSSKKKTYSSHGKCEIFGRCGGCQFIDVDYKIHLENKLKDMQRLLGDFGNVEGILGMENPYNYRNKVTATFRHRRSGEIIAGTYEEGTHNVLPVTNCLIEDKRSQEIISTIKTLLKSFRITVHNEDTGYGLLRHVMVRSGKSTGQIMVVIVTAEPTFPSKKNFVRALVDRHPQITTIVQNINPKSTSMVLGDRNQVLYGKGYIEDCLCGKRFKLSPTSFYQVNSLQTEVLYNKAMELAGLTGAETVIDAYCGIGTIGMVASDGAKEVIGVELNKEAIKDAITNSKLNGCKNISFYNNDAGKFMLNLATQDKKVDVVFMDPPRSGSSKEFMDAVISLKPQRVVYISCGPESLARDLKYMTKKGIYRVKKMVACDMFPFTKHVEVATLLQRIDS